MPSDRFDTIVVEVQRDKLLPTAKPDTLFNFRTAKQEVDSFQLHRMCRPGLSDAVRLPTGRGRFRHKDILDSA